MIEVFNITMTHDYEKGKQSAHLMLKPFSNLVRLAFNNRLLFKSEAGNLKCFCEEDRLVLGENDFLCFWLVYLNVDFVQYSNYQKEFVFDEPKFQWLKTTLADQENSYQFVLEELEDETVNHLVKANEKSPNHTIGLLAIPTNLLQERTHFNIHFETKNTFWQYRIQADFEVGKWEFSIEDKESKWEFEENEERGEVRFTSKTTLPYYKKADDRLLLKWKPLDDPFNFQTYQKILPFPNFRYQENINQKEISPVYIKI